MKNIPVISTLVDNTPSMDFEGQRLAERLSLVIIVLFAAVGFVWGYVCQQLIQTVAILGAGVLVNVLLVVPPWPMFRKNPLPWQDVISEGKSSSGGSKKKSKSS
ncbi:signal peptidase complex subunit 1-like [Halichondria panicea]|uniref:signal peptidase complex subunit 1-like n=1 Tax=Halichondria panicea TaxID=6063 RepID=UPI00312B8CD1